MSVRDKDGSDEHRRQVRPHYMRFFRVFLGAKTHGPKAVEREYERLVKEDARKEEEKK